MHLRVLLPFLGLLLRTCAGFLRTVPDISPFDVSYTNEIGVPNMNDIIHYNGTGDGAGIKSYWFISWLSCENGHDYQLITGTSNAGTEIQSEISLMDITAKTYSGRTWYSDGPAAQSTQKADSLTPEKLHIYASSPDQFSEWKVISIDPTYPFNLTHSPRGPNSYQGAAGTYIWGIGRAWAWDNPEAWTTGTLTINGTETRVIPEKSLTWMDFQYGPGYASEGWYSFVICLSNGVKITTMTTFPTDKYAAGSVATLMFLDGHHEVYAVDRDFHPKDPWVSSATNLTYYKSYQLNIPAKCISLEVRVAMEGGEFYFPDDLSKGIHIADTFAYYWGTFNGQYVTGWGNAERMPGSRPNSP